MKEAIELQDALKNAGIDATVSADADTDAVNVTLNGAVAYVTREALTTAGIQALAEQVADRIRAVQPGHAAALSVTVPPPLELNDDVAETICRQVAIGRSMALAAAAAGFDRTTVVKWQTQGNADLRAGATVAVGADGRLTGGTPQARFVVRLARARGELSDRLTGKALDGLDLPPSLSNVRDTLSVLKTLLPRYYGDRAADLDAQAEAMAEAQPDPSAQVGQPSGGVAVELVRCLVCGAGSATDDKRPTFCTGCGERLPVAE